MIVCDDNMEIRRRIEQSLLAGGIRSVHVVDNFDELFQHIELGNGDIAVCAAHLITERQAAKLHSLGVPSIRIAPSFNPRRDLLSNRDNPGQRGFLTHDLIHHLPELIAIAPDFVFYPLLYDQALWELAAHTPDDDRIESLTPQEVRILLLKNDGLTTSQIGKRLHVQPGTVRAHLGNIYRKLGTSNVHDLGRFVEANGDELRRREH